MVHVDDKLQRWLVTKRELAKLQSSTIFKYCSFFS